MPVMTDPTIQADVLNQIKAERDYQDRKWGGEFNDDCWSATDWSAFIEKYHAAAKVAAINGQVEEYKKQMVKVAALAAAAVEAAMRTGKVNK